MHNGEDKWVALAYLVDAVAFLVALWATWRLPSIPPFTRTSVSRASRPMIMFATALSAMTVPASMLTFGPTTLRSIFTPSSMYTGSMMSTPAGNAG